jgi:phage protein D/phage gp45-like
VSDARFYSPRAEVRVSGLALAADVGAHVTSVGYDNNVDIADMFTFVLSNPDNRFTDSPLLQLGTAVEIHLGYGSELRPMMLGDIASIQPSFPEGGAPSLTVTGYDRSHALRHNDPSRGLWKNTSDSLIASEIALLAGLVPIVDPSAYVHAELPQTSSDMAFLKERARANFFECYVHWDKLYFRFPRPQVTAPVLEWGRNLSSFTPRLSSAGAEGARVTRGYDQRLAQAVVGVATAAQIDADYLTERLGRETLDALVSMGRQAIAGRGRNREEPPAADPPDSPSAAARVALALLQEVLEGLYEGSGSCIGMPELRAGQMIVVEGLGKRFSGHYRLKRVTHTLDDGGYRTSFEVTDRDGTNLLGLLRRTLNEAPPPNHQMPTFGLRRGKVERNADTEGLGRVTVSYPIAGDDTESTPAWVMSPMTGRDTGFYTLPAEGDEVIVAFLEGRQRDPVVLGSVWSQRARPPVDNRRGGSDHRMLKTGKHRIELSDEQGKEEIVVAHSSGSSVKLKSDGGIVIEAKGDLDLTASGNVNLSAGNVLVKVSGAMDVSLKQ